MQKRNVEAYFVTLQGTDYAMGRAQAEMVRRSPGWLQFFRSAPDVMNEEQFKGLASLFERYCPGLNEELQGMADGIEIPARQVMFYLASYFTAGHCSQFAVLPQATADGHVLVGRSYEFGDQQEDFRLTLTRPRGRYAHISNSALLFGRYDGFNEKGLSVTMSAGGIPVGKFEGARPPVQDGFQFWALIRSALENCATVDEAVALCKEMPMAGNPIVIFADKAGNAARAEIYGPQVKVTRAGVDEAQPWIIATNHFHDAEMLKLQGYVMGNSPVREATIQQFLSNRAPKITRQDVRELLAAPYPQGLTCHYYDEFFGTLRSMIIDLTAGELEMCFGSPLANRWYTFDLVSAPPLAAYGVTLPLEKAEASFWAPAQIPVEG